MQKENENSKVSISIEAAARTMGEHLFITQVFFQPQQKKLSIVTEYHMDEGAAPSTFSYLSPVVTIDLPQGITSEELSQHIDLYVKSTAITIESVAVNFQIKRQARVVQGSYQQATGDVQVLLDDDSAYREQRIVNLTRNIQSIPTTSISRKFREEKEKFPPLTDPSADALVKDLSAKFKDNSLSVAEMEYYKGIIYVYDIVNKCVLDHTLIKKEADAVLQRLHIDQIDFEAGKSLDYQPKSSQEKTCCPSLYSFWNQHKVDMALGAALTAAVLSQLV